MRRQILMASAAFALAVASPAAAQEVSPAGAEGLQRLAEDGADLVVLDIGLPDMEGHDVLLASSTTTGLRISI